MFGQPRWPWITLLALQGFQLITLLPWAMCVMMSPMAFDAPGSDKMWQVWAFVLGLLSYPVWLLIADTIAWILQAKKKHTAAVIVCGLFTLPVPALAVVILFLINS